MNWSTLLIIGSMLLFIIILVVIIIIAANKEKKIYNEGIEVDSVVSRIEEEFNVDNHIRYYNAYVKYIGNDHLEHEALINVKHNFPYGRKIKVKYLPPKYDYVVFISQELEQGENNEL